jgi:replicative DNA helicase
MADSKNSESNSRNGNLYKERKKTDSLLVENCDVDNFERYCGDDKVVTSFELRDKLISEKKRPKVIVKSGIPGIDHACDGFQDGELIIISGPTKQGKTLLAQTFTVNFSKQKEYAGWFSYEVPARQFLEQFPVLPLFYLPSKNYAQDFNWLMERCCESHIKYHTRIFFIDHLHYLIDMARIKNPSLDIGTIVRRVKRFAVDNDFVIFLLCHIGKAESEQLSYRDLRDSSFIAQESDTVIMIKRTPADGENTARARVEFHRRTGAIEKKVNLIKVNGLLREGIWDERTKTTRERVD